MKPHVTLKASMVLTVLALSCSSQSIMAQGNLVVNGGFDTDASGWTLTNGSGYQSSFGNPPGSILLSNDSINAPTASQEINSLTPETTYIVSGGYFSGGVNGNNSLSVALDGIPLFETNAPANFTWNNFSFDYTAASPNALLSLSTPTHGKGYGLIIDNISMQVVPEPNSFCLIGVGGVMGAMLFRNRRKG